MQGDDVAIHRMNDRTGTMVDNAGDGLPRPLRGLAMTEGGAFHAFVDINVFMQRHKKKGAVRPLFYRRFLLLAALPCQAEQELKRVDEVDVKPQRADNGKLVVGFIAPAGVIGLLDLLRIIGRKTGEDGYACNGYDPLQHAGSHKQVDQHGDEQPHDPHHQERAKVRQVFLGRIAPQRHAAKGCACDEEGSCDACARKDHENGRHGNAHRGTEEPEQCLGSCRAHGFQLEVEIKDKAQRREHRNPFKRRAEDNLRQRRVGDDKGDKPRQGKTAPHIIEDAHHMRTQPLIKRHGAGRRRSCWITEEWIDHGEGLSKK